VRKYLGVWAAVATLCVGSWAQTPAQAPAPAPSQAPAPAPAPPQAPAPAPTSVPETPAPAITPKPELKYSRIEFFAGGSYAEAGLFNAGHWAGLPGWDASFDLNATSWIGLLIEGGQYFGTSKIPTASPAPFPPCPNVFCPGTSPTFNVKTREYNILFGVQFARRKSERWTPIGELLYGHQGTRGIASGGGTTDTEVGTGRALVAGGGIDYKISRRLGLRFKGDYLQTQSQFPTFARKKQDNFRFSVGIVIHNVHKKKRTLEEETQVEP
jgi:hypothetical protein